MNVESPTDAQGDIFRRYEDDLSALTKAFPLQPGQSGMVIALGPGRLCLDCVSRPDAFARLYPKLLHGAMLDALEHLDTKPAPEGELAAFTTAADSNDRRRAPSVSLGDDIRVESERLIGSGLELDGELLQLSAFSRG